MLNRRGQEAAPFELLVAVIIMGFVIFVGMRAMADLNTQKCYGETDAKLEEMKTKLGIVVTQRSPQSINFYLSGCFNPNDEKITIKGINEPNVCASYCGAAKRSCLLLQYVYTGSGGFSIRKCLNISFDTTFQTGGRCEPKDDMELVNFKDAGILQGNYLMINKTYATGTFPIICAYRRVD